MGVIIPIGIYAYMAFALQMIATKTHIPNAWLAWIPIANIYLMCKIAGKPGWWTVLALIPLVGIVVLAIVWAGIAKARNKPAWVGVLFVIPVINLIVPGVLAFSD